MVGWTLTLDQRQDLPIVMQMHKPLSRFVVLNFRELGVDDIGG